MPRIRIDCFPHGPFAEAQDPAISCCIHINDPRSCEQKSHGSEDISWTKYAEQRVSVSHLEMALKDDKYIPSGAPLLDHVVARFTVNDVALVQYAGNFFAGQSF